MSDHQLALILAHQHLQDDDDDDLIHAAALAAMFQGIADAKATQNRRRHRSRLYLRRCELMPDPRADSPWQRLWNSQEDRAFITTMGLDVDTFRYVLEGPGHFAELWDTTPIPRSDVSSTGQPRIGARSLDAAGALGLTLHWYGSAMLETSLQQIFALIPTSVSRYINFARDILLETLRAMAETGIKLPQGLDEYEAESSLIYSRHSLLEGAFASIDGLSLPVQESDDPELENATYNGWKSTHCINNVLVFSPRGVIIDAVINCPGSWHDSHVARPIFRRLQSEVPEGYYLVSDTAFPRGSKSIAGKIRAPLKAGERVPADLTQQADVLRYNRHLLSYRQTAEWGMRTMQGSFGRLRVPLPIESADARRQLLETCIRLNNLRAVCVGISQIRSVYMRTWRESEDERLWTDLGNLIFGDIRRRDRVSRFHVLPINA